MRGRDGYRAVLAERSLRRLLAASLGGRVGFLMLPLGLIFLAGSAGTAGVLVAAFSVTSALAPARGRIVDRHGARALTAFALACACSAWALVLASVADAPTVALAALSGLVGLLAPPLGPFTRAAYGRTLRDRGEMLQRTFGLDSAAEEAAVIFAPLLVAMFAGLLSPEIGLAIAAAALLAGTVATARWRWRRRRWGRSRSRSRRRRASSGTSAPRGSCWRGWRSPPWRAACSRAGTAGAGRRNGAWSRCWA